MKKTAAGYNSKEQQAARRKRTAEFLASLHHDKPTQVDDVRKFGIGPLINSGYIRRHKAGGYIRTAKEFHP